MKHWIFLGAIALMLSNPAFAQRTKKTTITTTTSDSSTTASSSSGGSASISHKPIFSGTFGLGTAASKFHFGVGFQAEFPTRIDNNQFRFGGQTGFLFGPSSPTTWIIPILATGTFLIPTHSELKPYIGLGMGVGIAHVSIGNTSVTVGGVTVSTGGASGTNVDFALLIKPGVEIAPDRKFFAELPFGTLGSDFAILPSVGYHFD